MAVTAEMVKELRERTQAGMMDCKKALTETDGNMDQAIELLREKGLAKAAKKAGRVASEGLVNIVIGPNGTAAAIVEVNSETDFVAKNDDFRTFVETLANLVIENDAANLEEFLGLEYPNEGKVADALQDKIVRIGENLNIRRFAKSATPGVVNVGYLHGGGKIGVIVQLKTAAEFAEVETMGKDIAMQIAAMNPKYVTEKEVDEEYIEQEKKILIQQALNEGKAADIVEKMVVGRLKKELKQVCLLEQAFVKDGDITVAQYVENVGKTIGKDIQVAGMIRYEVGEGIEKEEENFAEEVAKQMRG